MTDRYHQLVQTPPGRALVKRLGLPTPTQLRRFEPGQPLVNGPVLAGGAPSGRLLEPMTEVLRSVGADFRTVNQGEVQLEQSVAQAGYGQQATGDGQFAALCFDGSAIWSSDELRSAYAFFHPVVRRLAHGGRLLVLATPPDVADGWRHAVAQRALEGFVRSLAKELRQGQTAQLVYVAPGAEANLESTLRFFLSAKSAYVSGQVVRIESSKTSEAVDWSRPLSNKVAVVTGASRGIGAAIATTLARDGAHVVCVDLPAQGDDLSRLANDLGGSTLQLDIAADDAPQTLVDHLRERHNGVDVVVHNAGITRDKTLGRMSEKQWEQVISVNLQGQERITQAVLDARALRSGGRVVGVSSTSAIAGNRGQVNYATSKAGVIGLAQALAPVLAENGATINAVAPGFIETQMTAAMPVLTREAGRRMNSLAQGGQPVDVAETVAWLASPGSGGINGSVIRVCGQSLLGA